MKRGAPIERKAPLKPSKILPRRVPAKTAARPKSTPLRKSAAGQACTLRLAPVCESVETVVLCHLRTPGAAGMGQKPPDWHAVYGCRICHDILDGRDNQIALVYGEPSATLVIAEAAQRALYETHRAMVESGLLVMRGGG